MLQQVIKAKKKILLFKKQSKFVLEWITNIVHVSFISLFDAEKNKFTQRIVVAPASFVVSHQPNRPIRQHRQ